jgi:hypothetical protein
MDRTLIRMPTIFINATSHIEFSGRDPYEFQGSAVFRAKKLTGADIHRFFEYLIGIQAALRIRPFNSIPIRGLCRRSVGLR